MRRLGRFVARHPIVVLVAWTVAGAVAVPGALQLEERLANGGFDVPGSQSQVADALAREHVYRGDVSRVLVAIRGDDAGRHLVRARLRRVERAVRHATGVIGVRPLPRSDGAYQALAVTLRADLPAAQTLVPGVRDAARRAAAPARAVVVGAPAVFERYSQLARADLARVERISFPITGAIMLVAFLSIAATGVPLVLAALSLLVAFGVLFLVSHATALSVFASNTALVLGLGLSIDYALFNVTRFREALCDRDGDVRRAVEDTVATTGRAIAFSGLTIVIALGSLLAVDIGVFSGMALGAMASALVAMAGGLTLVPAVLRLAGTRIDRLAIRRAVTAADSGRLWRWLASVVVRHRVGVILVTVPVLLVAALPLLHARIAFPTTTALPRGDEVRAVSEDVGRAYGRGAVDPVSIVARADSRRLRRVIASDPGVGGPVAASRGRSGWIDLLVPLRASPDSAAAQATVRRLRHRLTEGVQPAAVAVGGETANGIDIVQRLDARTLTVVAIAVASSALLLLIAFRSIVVPLKAVASTLISVAATLGILTMLFADLGLGESTQLSYFVPVFLFAIVFGLSVDYEVFLLSRIREEWIHGAPSDEAIARGLVKSARSITLAGLVMTVVFLAQATSRMEPLKQLGLGMAIAVAIDVTIVRALLVPATMSLLGDRNWWLPHRAARRGNRSAPAQETVR